MSLDRIVFTVEEYMFFGQNGGKQHSFPEHAEGTINRFKKEVEEIGNTIVGTHREQDTQRWYLEDDDLTMEGWKS